MTTKTYSELSRLYTFEDRFEYLRLRGYVGEATFGFDRWINQGFYQSTEWKRARNQVITRDNGCDLGVPGYEIYDKIIIHHITPMSASDIENNEPWILDPEFLICVSHDTHNAIHYGDANQLTPQWEERRPGDTQSW